MKKSSRSEPDLGLQAFLKDYPHMSIKPTMDSMVLIQGKFWFSAKAKERPEITDSYSLRISVSPEFPGTIPKVAELDAKIPRTGEFHVNADASLCLGSPLRLLLKLSKNPSLSGFAADCLVPYLYAISHKLRFGGELLFSELPHYREGEIQDYIDLFGLSVPEQVYAVIALLGMKKRRANKLTCPCGCKTRLGRCRFNRRLHEFRRLASRSWFREQLR
jgi:hypothetical protein